MLSGGRGLDRSLHLGYLCPCRPSLSPLQDPTICGSWHPQSPGSLCSRTPEWNSYLLPRGKGACPPYAGRRTCSFYLLSTSALGSALCTPSSSNVAGDSRMWAFLGFCRLNPLASYVFSLWDVDTDMVTSPNPFSVFVLVCVDYNTYIWYKTLNFLPVPLVEEAKLNPCI